MPQGGRARGGNGAAPGQGRREQSLFRRPTPRPISRDGAVRNAIHCTIRTQRDHSHDKTAYAQISTQGGVARARLRPRRSCNHCDRNACAAFLRPGRGCHRTALVRGHRLDPLLLPLRTRSGEAFVMATGPPSEAMNFPMTAMAPTGTPRPAPMPGCGSPKSTNA